MQNLPNIKEQLASVHPVFRLPSTRVFFYDNVMKKSTKNQLQPRILVIASSGIFLLERKTFPKTLDISRVIPYSELVLITANNDESFEFFKAKVTMRLQHSKNAEIVAMVLAIRDGLFEDKPRYPKLVFDPETQKKIESYNFIFESENLISERFISLSLDIPKNELNYDQLLDCYEKLKASQSSFSITAEIIASKFAIPITRAIAYGNEMQTLQLKGLNLSSLLPYVSPIFNSNSSIQSVLCSSVTFTGTTQEYSKIWNSKSACQINLFSFMNCQLVSEQFIMFIKSFNFYPASVNSMVFLDSKISKEAFETILTVITTSPCFSQLSELYFSKIREKVPHESIIISFLNSPYIIAHHHLTNISLVDCELDIPTILSNATTSNQSINFLNLSGNIFLKEIPKPNYFQIDELDFSYCQFTAKSLISLLQSLSNSTKHVPSRLSLESLVMNPNEWNAFYSTIQTNPNTIGTLSSLTMLSWCGNLMQTGQLSILTQSLLNHIPNLKELGLSGTIVSTEPDSSLLTLSAFLEKRSIQKLEFTGGAKNTILGPKLIPIFKSLLKTKSIRMLDITGQQIGSSCFEYLAQLAESCLEEMRFDKNNPTNADSYISFILRVMNSKLVSAEWPESDSKFCISKVELSSRLKVTSQMKELMSQFKARFKQTNLLMTLENAALISDNISSPQNQMPTLTSTEVMRARSSSILKRRLKNEQNKAQKHEMAIDMSCLQMKSSKVDCAIFECLGEDALHEEPLTTALDNLNKQTSIESFLAAHKSK